MNRKRDGLVDAVHLFLTTAGLVMAVASVGIAIGFHLVLARRGLGVGELWGGGKIPGWSIPSGTEGLISSGNTFSRIGLQLGVLGVVVGVICPLAGLVLRTPFKPVLSALTIFAGLCGGFLCLHIICTLGGL